jgi:coenzyme PQQ precursor peptide PqqA
VSAYVFASNWGGEQMTWETPTFVEVKMDAEINSYQEDSDDRF